MSSKTCMHRLNVVLLAAAAITLASCGPHETAEQRRHDANTPAGKVGQAAYYVAQKADQAGHVIGRQLDRAAHDARAGWSEAAKNQKRK